MMARKLRVLSQEADGAGQATGSTLRRSGPQGGSCRGRAEVLAQALRHQTGEHPAP